MKWPSYVPYTERGRRRLIVRISIWNCTLSLHIKPEQVFRAINALNRSKRSRISLAKKSFFTRRRRYRCLSSLKTKGKPDAGWLVRERIVTSILQKSSGSANCFSFLTGPGIKGKSTNCKSPVLVCFAAFSSD